MSNPHFCPNRKKYLKLFSWSSRLLAALTPHFSLCVTRESYLKCKLNHATTTYVKLLFNLFLHSISPAYLSFLFFYWLTTWFSSNPTPEVSCLCVALPGKTFSISFNFTCIIFTYPSKSSSDIISSRKPFFCYCRLGLIRYS